jgi:type IV secretory pathway component VirB8
MLCLIEMIQGIFPLVEKPAIIVRSKDQSIYFSNLVNLKPKKNQLGYDSNIETVDQAIAKYFVSKYVKDRESYNFSKGEIEEVNRKFNHVRSTSSLDEYKAFQFVMSKTNPNNPLNDFGKNVDKSVEVESVQLIKVQQKGFANMAREYLLNSLPSTAQIRFIIKTRTGDENFNFTEQKQRYVAEISFYFEGVKKDQKGTIKFLVTNYKLFKVQ